MPVVLACLARLPAGRASAGRLRAARRRRVTLYPGLETQGRDSPPLAAFLAVSGEGTGPAGGVPGDQNNARGALVANDAFVVAGHDDTVTLVESAVEWPPRDVHVQSGHPRCLEHKIVSILPQSSADDGS